MKTALLIFIIISATLYSCSGVKPGDKDKQVYKEESIIIPKSKSELLFRQLKPESQNVEINAAADTLISGKNGTLIFVPKNSFINSRDETITGKVQIELLEVLSAKDFIKANLQTVSDGQVLQSQGMLFINAKSNGHPIYLASGKKLQIELPQMDKFQEPSDIKIFSGNYDTAGHINWSETGRIDDKLIPFPLDLFDYRYWTSYGFIRVPKNEGYQAPGNDEIIDSTTFINQKFANTFIATREFEERFRQIISAEWAIGHYTSYYSTTVQKGRMIKDSTITKIYLDNLDKDLWYCDSLAYSYMKSWVGKAEFNSYWYSEGEKFDLLDAFKKFYGQHLATVITFPQNIDLGSSNAREELNSAGYKLSEIDEIVGAYERQTKIITSRRNKQTVNRIIANSFAIAKLGWINCDQFYDEPGTKEADIIANSTNTDKFDFVSFTLVINNRRIALGGILNDKSEYCFTGNAKPYTKLPIGEKATIVGLTYKNEKPYFGTKEITLTEKGSYKIDLIISSIKEIDDKLSKLN